MSNSNDHDWESFCRLGEAIGDGLHHEDPWIAKEYKRLQKILLPKTDLEKNIEKKIRIKRNENINIQIIERLKKDKCICGSNLKQVRSGSKTVVCKNEECKKKYTYNSRKK
ncbi:hypothetical protein [Wenyingzhuangia sp. 2_MG-2023]|uniref:hypothetical protein n=1 Tax=Wenyingzhuangia sp. 2_MG-2023 TaxID=3062639 RepID=UPI0026E457F7|nr:hypothetical protein [Wenyingzhuangia sp. 2_MG-2023]MDO6737074.1 hypothetical protein [Wenyingzhuangia sp. 2_MG-2023]